MSAPPSPSAAEQFAAIILRLSRAVAARSAPRFGAGALAGPLIVLIVTRIGQIGRRFAGLAARLRDGRPIPRRRRGPRRPAAAGRPRRPDPLPKHRGWLLRLVPGAAVYRSQLEFLLRDPATAALLAEAPASLGRPLRSLCRMLGIKSPPGLAPPRPTPPPAAADPEPDAPQTSRASPRRPHPAPRRASARPPRPPAYGHGLPLPT